MALKGHKLVDYINGIMEYTKSAITFIHRFRDENVMCNKFVVGQFMDRHILNGKLNFRRLMCCYINIA